MAHVRKGSDDDLRSSVAKVTALQLEVAGPVPDVIARAKAGDRGAFAELYDRHIDSVYRYLLYRDGCKCFQYEGGERQIS